MKTVILDELHYTSKRKYARLIEVHKAWMENPAKSRSEVALFDARVGKELGITKGSVQDYRNLMRLGTAFSRPSDKPITPEQVMGFAAIFSSDDKKKKGLGICLAPDPVEGYDMAVVAEKAKSYPDFERVKKLHDVTYANNAAQRWALRELYPNNGRFF